MKRLLTLILVFAFLAAGCGAEKKASEIVDKADELVDELDDVIGNAPAPSGTTEEKSSSVAQWSDFDGKKGKIIVAQTLERYGITITLDHVIFDDDPGLFSPPPEGMIFFYPIFTIANKTETQEELDFSTAGSCILSVDGEEYKRTMDPLYSYGGEESTLDLMLGYDETTTAMTGFVIPSDWQTISLHVNQSYRGTTPKVKMLYELKRSDASKEVQLVEAGFAQELPTAPRLSYENYLTKEEVKEVTGLHVVGVEEAGSMDHVAGATYLLHEDENADPATASGLSYLRFNVFYPQDALLEYSHGYRAPAKQFNSEKEGEYFVEDIPDLGEAAFWYQHPADPLKTLYLLTKNEFGDYLIVVEPQRNSEESWVLPLGQKIMDFLKNPHERATPEE